MIRPRESVATVCGTCQAVSESGSERCEECGALCFPLRPVGNDSEYQALGDFAPTLRRAAGGPLLLSNAEPVTGHAENREP